MKYVQALSKAQADLLREDERYFIFGLDVTDHKAIFGSLVDVNKEFDESRRFNTPISEDAMTGAAIGAALQGMRPIHVHIRADFLLLACNQLINMASNLRYLSNGKIQLPILIRAIIGRGWGQGAQHSKSTHGLFAQIPGLSVIMPTTPQDAYSMTKAAAGIDSPVISLEHRWLYDIEGEIDPGLEVDPFGSELLRQGKDLTVVATSWMSYEALMAADILKDFGVEVEVLNLKSARPYDEQALIKSVSKTKKCVIADYDWIKCGLSSEIAAFLYQRLFNQLERPIERVGFGEMPCPTARHLENQFYPTAKDILIKAKSLFDLKALDVEKFTYYSYEHKFTGPF